MKKLIVGVCAVLAAVAWGSDAGISHTRRQHSWNSDEPLGTIIPLNGFTLPVTPATVSNTVVAIREAAARSGIRQIALSGPGHSVRVSGMLPVEKYRELGKAVNAIKQALKDGGIEICFRMGPTVNVGINHPWRHFTREDGSERAFTACPGDPEFRKEFARQCAAVAAECRPFFYMMEDDFRYWGAGCFCPEHIAAVSEPGVVAYSRESLVAALRDPAQSALRQRWQRIQVATLVQLAEAAEKAIHEVSPETRIGLSAPGMLSESATAEIARALAGPGRRAAVRWWGAIYGTDYPLDLADVLYHARWSKENVSDGIECIYEADPCPRSAFYASGARLSAMCSTVYAFGFDGLWYWGADSDGIAATPQYLDEHRALAGRFEAIREAAAKGNLVGVSAVMNPNTRVLNECGVPSGARPLDDAAAARLLNRLGIPCTTRPGKVNLYAGHWTFEGMDDDAVREILSGGAILDGAAAEALTQRGFSELTGVSAAERDRVDFTGEKIAATGAILGCSFHANYGLDDCRVSRLTAKGCEEVSYFFDTTAERRVQPAITRFKNELGGRVAVIAVNLAGAKTPNLYNAKKRDVLCGLFRWVGGDDAVPVRVMDQANVMVVASESDDGLLVHALNLSCDVCRKITFELCDSYRDAAVEVLDGANWRQVKPARDGRKITLDCELPVYRTLVIRLKRL